jgi:hypothetical protein
MHTQLWRKMVFFLSSMTNSKDLEKALFLTPLLSWTSTYQLYLSSFQTIFTKDVELVLNSAVPPA